jgi:hypothetical protein
MSNGYTCLCAAECKRMLNKLHLAYLPAEDKAITSSKYAIDRTYATTQTTTTTTTTTTTPPQHNTNNSNSNISNSNST